MGFKADSGMKFDQGKVREILTLAYELNDSDLSELINELLQYRSNRNKNNKEETIRL